ERMCSAAGSVVIQLLVNCRTRLAGKIGIFGSSRHALLAVASDADLLCLGRAPFRFGVGENLQEVRRPDHLRDRRGRGAVGNLLPRRRSGQDAECPANGGIGIDSVSPSLNTAENPSAPKTMT